MELFLKRLIVFILISASFFLMILSLANGHTDPFYIRFTTTKQQNLILGTSRAAQGLMPSVFDSILHKTFLNYSFTLAHSPYGETYLNSIKKKVAKTEYPGLFVLAVDPWSISSKLDNPNDSTSFRELDKCLSNTPFVNHSPNFFYLLKNLSGKYYSVLFNPNSGMYLHQDGWLEVTVDMDSSKVNERTNTRIEHYRQKNLPLYHFSTLRMDYLKKTIGYLSAYGDVFIVRLPVHPLMMEIEEELMPDFNRKMEALAPITEGYLDLTYLNEEFDYSDGNHLHKTSGKKVSIIIANWLKELQRTNPY